MTEQLNQFEAAKIISETLKKAAPEERKLILRWVAESVGITSPVERLDQDRPDDPNSDLDKQNNDAEKPGTAVDIKSFVQEKDPKSNNQFAAVVAYFHRFVAPEANRANTIKAADLIEATRKAGRARMSNPGDTLKKAMQQGYLDQSGRGEYSINTVGENLVALTLPSSSSSSGANVKPRRKAKKIVKKASKKKASKKKVAKKTSSRSRN